MTRHPGRHVWLNRIITLIILAGMLFSLPVKSTARAQEVPAAPDGWLSAGDGSGPASPTVQVELSSPESITLSAAIPGVWSDMRKDASGQLYTRLYGSDFGHPVQIGQPDLPVLRRDVEIPFEAQASLEILNVTYQEVSLADLGLPVLLWPVQPPQSKCAESPAFSAPDPSAYQSDGFAPQAAVNLGEEYILRGHRAVTVEVWPVQYNPQAGTVRLVSSIQFRIRLEDANLPLTRQMSERYASPAFETTLSGQLLNFNQGQPARGFGPKDPVGYLIITADAYLPALSSFITLKQAQGFTVSTAALSQTGATTTAIQAYIQNAYDNWPLPPSYVLLVGDVADGADSLPAYDGLSTTTVTDLYYVTVQGADWIPDIHRGRFPARDLTQLGTMTARTIAYAELSGAESWVKKVALLATDDSGFYGLAEATQNYVVNTYTLPLGYTGIFPNNPQPGGDKLYAITYSAGTPHVVSAVNDSRVMVIYTGHGSEGGWAGPAFSQANVRSITAANVYPFIGSFACRTNNFEFAEVFGETWLIQENKGAIAYLGSSDYSYWDQDDLLERRLVDKLYEEAAVQASVAGMTHFGLLAVNDAFPGTGTGNARYYWETYNILGDPSVQIILEPRSPDFTLSVTPSRLELCNAGQAAASITLAAVNDFNEPVTLDLLNEPTGVSGLFDPNPLIPPSASALTISNDGSAASGFYTVQVEGSSTGLAHTQDLTLGIYTTDPGQPVLLAPANNALNQLIRPAFTWSEVSQAGSYHLQVAADSTFNNIILDVPGVAQAAYTPGVDLDTSTLYYWRVRGENACGESAYSPVFHFTTAAAPGDCPLGSSPIVLHTSTFEDGPGEWTHHAALGGDTWNLSTTASHSPTHAFLGVDPAAPSDQRLVSPAFVLPDASQQPITLTFWHKYAFENDATCWDGGILEASTNSGASWTQVPASLLLTDPYNGTIYNSLTNPLVGKPAYCGSQDWTRSVVDLSSYAGQSLLFRFRLGSDNSLGRDGWYVDDVSVKSCTAQYGVGMTADSDYGANTPGQSVSYTIHLTNLGSSPDTFTITAESEHGWSIGPIAQPGLAPGESADVWVTVFIPAGVDIGLADTLTVRAESQADPNTPPASASLAFTTTVVPFKQYLPVINQQ